MAEEEPDYYALLGLQQDATLKDITRAYRMASLKVHPDRNPDNPLAAQLFHELGLARDALTDPTRRSTYDALLTSRLARKARFASLDATRKSMAEDLERREREWRDSEIVGKAQKSELERLKEEGRRMREGKERERDEREKVEREEGRREKKRRKVEEEEERRNGGGVEVVGLGELDTTVKVRWVTKVRPELVGKESVVDWLVREKKVIKEEEVDSVVIAGSKKKHTSAVLALRSLSAAVRVVEKCKEEGWEGVEVTWAAGKEPEVLGGRKEEKEKIEVSIPKTKLPKQSDEASILEKMRAREDERKRLEEEIRRQDEAEEGIA